MKVAKLQEYSEAGTLILAGGGGNGYSCLGSYSILKFLAFIPFNSVTPASRNLFKGDHLQYGRSLRIKIFTSFCSFMRST